MREALSISAVTGHNEGADPTPDAMAAAAAAEFEEMPVAASEATVTELDGSRPVEGVETSFVEPLFFTCFREWDGDLRMRWYLSGSKRKQEGRRQKVQRCFLYRLTTEVLRLENDTHPKGHPYLQP